MLLSDERRRFKRYQRNTSITLRTPNGSFIVNLLDYSPIGMRVKIFKSILNKGDDVEVIIDKYHRSGKVVWVQDTMAGIYLNNIQGNLRDYELSELLIGLKRSSKTGILKIFSGNIKKVIYIRDGDPVFATSNIEDERLGEYLLRTGRITIDAYNRSVEILKKTNKRQGAILVELGYIKVEELPGIVRAQIEDMIENTFKLFEGEFEFVEGPLPTHEVITLKLSVGNIIFRGVMKIESLQYIRSRLPDLNSVLIPSQDPYHLFQDISLDVNEKNILQLIDSKRTINDILRESPLKHFDTLKLIYAFLSTRMVEVKVEEKVSVRDMDEVLKNNGIGDDFVQELNELYQKCQDMDYYELLGVQKNSTLNDIRRSYYQMVKRFHPDRYFRIEHEDFKNKISKIFSLINEAYSTLSDPVKKSTYDTMLRTREGSIDPALQKFNEGMELFKDGRYGEACTLFGQAVYLSPQVAKYHLYYGISLSYVNKNKDAEQEILRAIQLSPDNDEYLVELGNLYLRLGMKLRARRTFERVLSISPHNKRALEGLKQCE